MSDLSNPPAVNHPASLPAKRRPARHNEWTRAKMVTFLRELAATQSVALAAKAVGMSRTSAYNLRNRLQGSPFSLGWEVALELGLHQLAQAVLDRAVNGVEVEHYYHGELVATSRRHDNGLARWILENPWKLGRQQMAREYSAQGFDALLERIESASLGWEGAEQLPGVGWPLPTAEEGLRREADFAARESWYAADAVREESQRRGRRGGGGW